MGNDDIKKIFQEVLGVSKAEANKMLRRGYDTLESVAEAGTDDLVQSLKLDFKTALEMIDKAYDYLHYEVEAKRLSQRIACIKEKLAGHSEASILAMARRTIKVYMLLRVGEQIDTKDMSEGLKEILSRLMIESDGALAQELESNVSSLKKQPDFDDALAKECEEYLSTRYGQLFSRIEETSLDLTRDEIVSIFQAAGPLAPFVEPFGMTQLPQDEADPPYVATAKKVFNDDAFILLPSEEIQEDIRLAIVAQLIDLSKERLDIETLADRTYTAMTEQKINTDSALFRRLQDPDFEQQRAIGHKSGRLMREYLQEKYGNVLDALQTMTFPFSENDEKKLERLYKNPKAKVTSRKGESLLDLLASKINGCATPRLRHALAAKGIETDEALLAYMQAGEESDKAIINDMRQYIRERYEETYKAMAKEGFPASFAYGDVFTDVFNETKTGGFAYDPSRDAIQQANEAYASMLERGIEQEKATDTARELLSCGLIAIRGEAIDMSEINKKNLRVFAKEGIFHDYELYTLYKSDKLQEIPGIGITTIDSIQSYLENRYHDVFALADNITFPIEKNDELSQLISQLQEAKANALQSIEVKPFVISMDSMLGEPVDFSYFSNASIKALGEMNVVTDRDLFRVLSDYEEFAKHEKVTHATCEQINDYLKERYGEAYEQVKANGSKLRFKGSPYLKGLLGDRDNDYAEYSLRKMLGQHLDYFMLSPRAYVTLLRNEIYTDRDLFEAVSNMADFRSLPGVSRNIINEVKEYAEKRYQGIYDQLGPDGFPESFVAIGFLKRLFYVKQEDEDDKPLDIDYTGMSLAQLMDSPLDPGFFCPRTRSLLESLGIENDHVLFARLEDIESFREAIGNDRVVTREINGYIRHKYGNVIEEMQADDTLAGKKYVLRLFGIDLEDDGEKLDYATMSLEELLDSPWEEKKVSLRTRESMEHLEIATDRDLFTRLEDVDSFKEATGNDRIVTRDINRYIKEKYAHAFELMKANDFSETFVGKNYLLHVFKVHIEQDEEVPGYESMTLSELLGSPLETDRFCVRSQSYIEQMGVSTDGELFAKLEDMASFKASIDSDRVVVRDINNYIRDKYAHAVEQMKEDGFKDTFPGRDYILQLFKVVLPQEEQDTDATAETERDIALMTLPELLDSSIVLDEFSPRSQGYLEQLGITTDRSLFEQLQDWDAFRQETGSDRVFIRDINGYIRRRYIREFERMRKEGFKDDFAGRNYLFRLFRVQAEEIHPAVDYSSLSLEELLDTPLDIASFVPRSQKYLEQLNIDTNRALLEKLDDIESFKEAIDNDHVFIRDINRFIKRRYVHVFEQMKEEGFKKEFAGKDYVLGLFGIASEKANPFIDYSAKSLEELLDSPLELDCFSSRSKRYIEQLNIDTDRALLEKLDDFESFKAATGNDRVFIRDINAHLRKRYAHLFTNMQEKGFPEAMPGQSYMMRVFHVRTENEQSDNLKMPVGDNLQKLLDSPLDKDRFASRSWNVLQEQGIETDRALLERLEDFESLKSFAGNARVFARDINGYCRNRYAEMFAKMKAQGFPESFPGLGYLQNLFDNGTLVQGPTEENLENKTLAEMLEMPISRKTLGFRLYNVLMNKGVSTDGDLLKLAEKDHGFEYEDGFGGATGDIIKEYLVKRYSHLLDSLKATDGFPGRDYLMVALGETEYIPTLAEMLESPIDYSRFSRPLVLSLRKFHVAKDKDLLAIMDKGTSFNEREREEIDSYFSDYYEPFYEDQKDQGFPLQFVGLSYLKSLFDGQEVIEGWTIDEMLDSQIDEKMFSPVTYHTLMKLGYDTDRKLLSAMSNMKAFRSEKGIAAATIERIKEYFKEYYAYHYEKLKEQGFPVQFEGLSYLKSLFGDMEDPEQEILLPIEEANEPIEEAPQEQPEETNESIEEAPQEQPEETSEPIEEAPQEQPEETNESIEEVPQEQPEETSEPVEEPPVAQPEETNQPIEAPFEEKSELTSAKPQEETPQVIPEEPPVEEAEVHEEILEQARLKDLAAMACKAYHDAEKKGLSHAQAENMMRDALLQEYIKVSDEPIDEQRFTSRAMGILYKNDIKKDSDVFQAMTQKTEEMSRVLGDKLAEDLGEYMRNKFGAILCLLQEVSYPLEIGNWSQIEELFENALESASKRRSVYDVDLAAIYDRETLRNTSDDYIQKEIREVLFADLVHKCNEKITPGSLSPRVAYSLAQLNIATDGELYDFSKGKDFVLAKGLGERALEQVEEYLDKKYAQYRWILNNLRYPFNGQDLAAVEALYDNAIGAREERVAEEEKPVSEKVVEPKTSTPVEIPSFLPQTEIKTDFRERIESMRDTLLEDDKDILSTRAYNLLAKLSIVTEGDLLSAMKDQDAFTNTRGMGKANVASCRDLIVAKYKDIYEEMEDVGFPYDFDGLETLKNLFKEEAPQQMQIPFFDDDDEEQKEESNDYYTPSINMDDLPVYNYDLDDMESFVVDEITDDTPLNDYGMDDAETFVVNEIVEPMDENVQKYLEDCDHAIVDETTQDLYDSLASHGIVLYSQLMDAYYSGQLASYPDVDMVEANDLIFSIKEKAERYADEPQETFEEYIEREGGLIDEFALPQDDFDALAREGIRYEKELCDAFAKGMVSLASVYVRRYYNNLREDYLNASEETDAILDNTVYQVLKNNPLKSFTESELVEASGIDPRDFYTYLSDMLDNYDITVKKGRYAIVLPRARIVAMEMGNDRMARVLLRCLGGDSYEQIGDTIGLDVQQVKAMVRQGADELRVASLEHYGTDMMEEDRLAHVYQTYNIPDDAYQGFMNISAETLNFLALYYKKGTRDMMGVLEDPNAPKNVKEGIEKYRRKSIVRLEGVDLLVNKQVMEDYILKTRCTEQTDIAQFAEYYKDFIAIYHLDEYPQLAWVEGSETKIMQRMMRGRHVLCRSKTVLRFYDIDSRDYTKLKDELDLGQFHGLEMSTETLFDAHPELMKEYDILDKHELHFLLRRIYKQDEVPGLTFGRNPNLVFA